MKALMATSFFLATTLVWPQNQKKVEQFDHSHRAWSRVLRTVVHTQGQQTLVNYTQLKAHPQVLEAYLAQLSSVSKPQYKRFDREQKLAFLINTYNAFALKLIIDNYPVASIKKINLFLFSPWKKKFFRLLGEKQSLDFVEHQMLRKHFQEPRIHFAIVCAALSCPNLRPAAYTADKLEIQLAEAERAFFQDKNKNVYHQASRTVKVSKIFEWFKDDFKAKYGPLAAYLKKKMGLSGKFKIDYLEYDWGLNDWKPDDK